MSSHCSISGASREIRRERIEQQFDSTVMIMELLHHIREHISPAIRVWNGFNALESNKCFINSLEDHAAIMSFNTINDKFGELVDLEQTLLSMWSSCEVSANTVSCQQT